MHFLEKYSALERKVQNVWCQFPVVHTKNLKNKNINKMFFLQTLKRENFRENECLPLKLSFRI